MRGNCTDCPMEMDPPKIQVTILDPSQNALTGYYCKYSCASEDASNVLKQLAENGGSFKDVVTKDVPFKAVDMNEAVVEAAAGGGGDVAVLTGVTEFTGLGLASDMSRETAERLGTDLGITVEPKNTIIKQDDGSYIGTVQYILNQNDDLSVTVYATTEAVLVEFSEAFKEYTVGFDPNQFDLKANYEEVRNHVKLVFDMEAPASV